MPWEIRVLLVVFIVSFVSVGVGFFLGRWWEWTK